MTLVSSNGSLDRSRTCGSTAARLAPGWLFRFATLSGLIPTLSVLIRSGSIQGRVGIRVNFCLYLCDFFLYLWELFLYTSDRFGKFDTQLEL